MDEPFLDVVKRMCQLTVEADGEIFPVRFKIETLATGEYYTMFFFNDFYKIGLGSGADKDINKSIAEAVDETMVGIQEIIKSQAMYGR